MQTNMCTCSKIRGAIDITLTLCTYSTQIKIYTVLRGVELSFPSVKGDMNNVIYIETERDREREKERKRERDENIDTWCIQ